MSAAPQIDLTNAETFPSRRTEAWKYSDLKRWLREAPEPSGTAVIDAAGQFDDRGGEAIVFANGRPVGVTDFIASGVQTLRLRFISDAVGTGHTASARIAARPGTRLLLLETHEGKGSAYVAHNKVEIDVARDAEVTRIVLIEEPEDAISVTNAEVRLEAGGRYRQTVVTTGAKLQRIETQLSHGAEGADARLDGLYLLKGSRHADLTTVVDHRAADGTTSQLTKGVVHDTARGVFQGKIIVERGADGTDARMAHNALIASERGEIDAKPELIIYADDVQCAHGNTVGTLDESALFYMQQRGIPADEARALLVQAFLFEVVDRIEDEAAKEVVRAWLTARL
ncbi:Fe-S cluster assembly protein SufD [Brevundimonas sp.]|uniref:Fe-S cluster assembly protein SufD n=1 Tax=Brevundimonas sp. TaxID=1871086 RepID=UPI002ED83614